MVAFAGHAEWLAVAAAGYVALHARELHLSFTAAQQLGYGLALLVVVGTIGVRRAKANRSGELGGAERDRESLAPDADAAER